MTGSAARACAAAAARSPACIASWASRERGIAHDHGPSSSRRPASAHARSGDRAGQVAGGLPHVGRARSRRLPPSRDPGRERAAPAGRRTPPRSAGSYGQHDRGQAGHAPVAICAGGVGPSRRSSACSWPVRSPARHHRVGQDERYRRAGGVLAAAAAAASRGWRRPPHRPGRAAEHARRGASRTSRDAASSWTSAPWSPSAIAPRSSSARLVSSAPSASMAANWPLLVRRAPWSRA